MFETEEALELALAEPSPGLVADLAELHGDLIVLGAGGKMGPSLCRLARRGLDAAGRTSAKVLAVSRWSDPAVAEGLRAAGVETVTHDLGAGERLAELPDAGCVVYMVGAKFGSTGRPAQTWATNVLLPAAVADRYRDSRTVAFSTGNVYPLVPVESGGCRESDPTNPVGEYAMSCLGRERVLEYAAIERDTPMLLLRLNYAVDLRYGVLADVARAVYEQRPVDLSTGHANVVWQGYANEVALRSLRLASAPATVLNVTGPETVSVRRLAAAFGERFGVEPVLSGTEEPTSLLSDAGRCHQLFGYPALSVDALVEAQADWIVAGNPMWDKPTGFQRRDGRF